MKSASPGCGLLIFDCDGVLVDSEVISAGVLAEALKAHGAEVDEAMVYRRFLGRSMDAVRDVLATDFGLRVREIFDLRLRDRLNERFRRELRPIPGVTQALGKMDVRRCVASSSRPERLRLTLDVTGLLPLFEPHIFSATMVKNGKPAPDLFLHAARRMGVAPSSCVVIEDSPAGVEAAKRAGMRVYAFTGGAHAARCDLATALAALAPDAMFDNMLRLPELVSEAVGAS